VSESSASSPGRRATSLAVWIGGSIVVVLLVVAPALGVLLLWAWGKWGSE